MAKYLRDLIDQILDNNPDNDLDLLLGLDFGLDLDPYDHDIYDYRAEPTQEQTFKPLRFD